MKRGLLKFLIGLTFFVLLGGANYALRPLEARWDVTVGGLHTLSSSTKEFLRTLEQDVTVTVLHVGMPPKYLEDLLREYHRMSDGRVTSEIVDPLVSLGTAAQFGAYIQGDEKRAVVQSGQNREDVDFSKGPLDENQLNNAIIRVTRPAQTACFLAGHKESDIAESGQDGYSTFAGKLRANNIIPEKLLLQKEHVPDTCDVLIIAGPRVHLSDSENNAISRYLEAGGDALILVEHTVISTPQSPLTEELRDLNPSLDDLLNPWGIAAAFDVVVDLGSHASGDVGSPATKNYVGFREIKEDLDYTFYIRPRSLRMLSDRKGSLKLLPFILTESEQASWGETDRYLNVKFDEGVDRPGPVPIGYVIWDEAGEGEDSDTRIIAITDADFLTNAYISSYSNLEMGLKTVNWLTASDYQVFVDKKDLDVKTFNLVSSQKSVLVAVLVAGPLVLALLGGVCLWTRRVR